ncbi:MAG: ABC transporter permease [Elusimicrobiales bacterium]|nr:ABC transporter permease [Elusimicrobiales bacterium]
MKISEALRTGFTEIRAHKTRSFLSFFSISIGSAAFMYTFAMISSMNRRMATALELMGPGRMNVETKQNYEQKAAQSQRKLSYSDALAIRREMPWLYMVSPVASKWRARFRHGNKTGRIDEAGITPEWAKREWVYKLRGRFINDYDVSSSARVCVVVQGGDWLPGKRPIWRKIWNQRNDVAEYLKHSDLLGSSIVLEGHLYKVVGVIRQPPWGNDPRWFTVNQYPDVLVPITTFMRFIASESEEDSVEQISVDAGSGSKLGIAKRQLETLLKTRHDGANNFKIRSMSEIMGERISQQRQWMFTILAIGIIAILSGGIGIMNVTLATIYARIKEIGIRRAIGATRLDIVTQFVVEATLLGLLGGILGIGLGYLMINYMDAGGGREMKAFVWWIPVASAAIAMFAGFAFSLWPAWSASKLDPVEALRYE